MKRTADVMLCCCAVLAGRARANDRCHLRWDGCDDAGRPVAGGVYFVRLEIEGRRESCKLVKLD